ncbi:MAG TPA: hypothetical protein VFF40_03880 [Acidimicrobiia bacterium]|nr:hypothetical protein [Acidimicrobiia bacterium]
MSSRPATTRRARPAPTGASRARRLVAPALVGCAALILAACGSSGSDTKTSSDTNATSDSADAPAAAVVKTASNAGLGTILVDQDGRTLYTLTSGGQAVECTGACLAAWPPLLLLAGTDTPTGGSGVTGLATVTTPDGEQVTHDGLPLYRFAADSAAGDANGAGISSFGGVWNVVTISGGDSSSDSSSTTQQDSRY